MKSTGIWDRKIVDDGRTIGQQIEDLKLELEGKGYKVTSIKPVGNGMGFRSIQACFEEECGNGKKN